jgi:hypothetical protein
MHVNRDHPPLIISAGGAGVGMRKPYPDSGYVGIVIERGAGTSCHMEVATESSPQQRRRREAQLIET